jgi:hypothetical protein
MKAQLKYGLRTLTMLAAMALVGFAQAPTDARAAVIAPGGAKDNATNAASGNQATPQRKTASPGVVNYVEGHATLNGQPLAPDVVGSAVVGPNQAVATTDGYVEVLLTPGAFLRVGHNSEVRLISVGLTGVNAQVDRGSALVEVADLIEGSRLTFAVNGVPVQIKKKGLYEFDAAQHAVRVLDGKAEVQETANDKITLKKGDEVSVAGEPLKKHDFDVKAAKKEPLYVWSKVRSEQQSQANQHTADVILAGGGWYGPGWYWNPFWASYAFVPGSGMLYSPFGWGFYSPLYYGGLWGTSFGYTPYRYAPRYYGRHGYYARGFAHGHVGGIGAMHGRGGFHGGGFNRGSHGGGFHGGAHGGRR